MISDADRPLAPRGEKAAPKMGAAMRENGLQPDLILCSPAVRTRQTLERAHGKAWDHLPEARYDERLYHKPTPVMMEVLRGLPEHVDHAMIVGHNPELQSLAVQLVRTGPKKALEALRGKFPTAGVASIRFEIDAWPQVAAGTGELVLYMTPKSLRAA